MFPLPSIAAPASSPLKSPVQAGTTSGQSGTPISITISKVNPAKTMPFVFVGGGTNAAAAARIVNETTLEINTAGASLMYWFVVEFA